MWYQSQVLYKTTHKMTTFRSNNQPGRLVQWLTYLPSKQVTRVRFPYRSFFWFLMFLLAYYETVYGLVANLVLAARNWFQLEPIGINFTRRTLFVFRFGWNEQLKSIVTLIAIPEVTANVWRLQRQKCNHIRYVFKGRNVDLICKTEGKLSQFVGSTIPFCTDYSLLDGYNTMSLSPRSKQSSSQVSWQRRSYLNM